MPSTKQDVFAIDPSTTCTGVCVNEALFCFANSDDIKTKKGDLSKWFNIASDACTVLGYSTPPLKAKSSFTDSEIHKLEKYNFITDKIIDTIKSYAVLKDSTCLIEGYSYSSAAGRIIDLVTYSTLLRYKLHTAGVNIIIVPPTTLKMSAGKLTYPGKNIGKKKPKWEWRNNEGMSAGSFTKHEMYKVITENPKLKDDWSDLLRVYETDQLSAKNISKPFDDVNDSYILYHAYLAGHINN